MLAIGLERFGAKKVALAGPLASVIGPEAIKALLRDPDVAAAIRRSHVSVEVSSIQSDPYAVHLSILLKSA
jgi:hypothetical protein